MDIDIKKQVINYKARITYNEQKQNGTNKKLKPKEEHKKRGPKPKPAKEPKIKPVKEPKIKKTLEQLNKEYNILMSLVGKTDNKYIIDKLKALNRKNKELPKKLELARDNIKLVKELTEELTEEEEEEEKELVEELPPNEKFIIRTDQDMVNMYKGRNKKFFSGVIINDIGYFEYGKQDDRPIPEEEKFKHLL